MEIHALHALFALHSKQVHLRTQISHLLLLHRSQVTRPDPVARLGKLQGARGVHYGRGQDRFALPERDLAGQGIFDVAKCIERSLHVLRNCLLLLCRPDLNLGLERAPGE